jgi:hypothetical protein
MSDIWNMAPIIGHEVNLKKHTSKLNSANFKVLIASTDGLTYFRYNEK